MITIFSALFGLVSALLPKLLGAWETHAERRHELKMIELQSKLEFQRSTMQLRETELVATVRQAEALARHDATLHKNSSQWVTDFAAAIRPTVTLGLLLIVVFLLVARSQEWLLPWEVDTYWSYLEPLVVATWSFWFGSRLYNRPDRPHT